MDQITVDNDNVFFSHKRIQSHWMTHAEVEEVELFSEFLGNQERLGNQVKQFWAGLFFVFSFLLEDNVMFMGEGLLVMLERQDTDYQSIVDLLSALCVYCLSSCSGYNQGSSYIIHNDGTASNRLYFQNNSREGNWAPELLQTGSNPSGLYASEVINSF